MNFIEHVYWRENLLAIILRREFEKDGIEFITEDSLSQQLGYMKHPAGYKIQPHIHLKLGRHVEYTQEVLWIKSGKIKVNFYSIEKEYLESRELRQNDVILLVSGGHGFEILETAEIIEIKQGPYAGENDKERF